MKGKDHTWMILGVLALAAAVSYYLLEVQGIAQEPGDVAYVWDLEADQIVGVRVIDHASGSVTALEKAAGATWRVTEPVPEVAEAAECASLVYALAYMPVHRTIEDPPEGELAAYGLITPAYTIEVRVEDGRTIRLQVGAHYPSGSYFARREGEQAVILVQDYAVEDVVRIVEEPPVPEPTPGVPLEGPILQEP